MPVIWSFEIWNIGMPRKQGKSEIVKNKKCIENSLKVEEFLKENKFR